MGVPRDGLFLQELLNQWALKRGLSIQNDGGDSGNRDVGF